MSLYKSLADFCLVIPQAEMTDWQVVEGHQSSASWSPGAQVMARPHPQVLLLLRATAETSPLGCHVAVSMEMSRQAGHGSDSHLYGQRLCVSEETSLPNSSCTQVAITPTPKPFTLSLSLFLLSSLKPVQAQRRILPTPLKTVQPSLPWQCYPCEACWEQWWDVRLDLQVWAGPKRGCNAKGLPTLSMAHAPLWFLSGGVKVSFPNAVSFKILSQLAAEENWLDWLSSVSLLICVIMSH